MKLAQRRGSGEAGLAPWGRVTRRPSPTRTLTGRPSRSLQACFSSGITPLVSESIHRNLITPEGKIGFWKSQFLGHVSITYPHNISIPKWNKTVTTVI